ncbi:hypothetical protein [Chiayiivirga flava]|uniref:Uncharacterized protein n=1 Tax=Chiayiivirga flava TaxID=659595 RepID=A0A7W8D8X9_9GAMM|nr:hypothetical protein [Chiayiivirga flava]MBB5208308.1 hypothetical protein [Chiayiivirga flava]
MDAFRWISVALSMLLGLGVTRLLSSAIAVFRSRQRATLDWVPLAWAAIIFLEQLQFWWAIIELPSLVPVWTIGSFLLLVCLTLLLYVAAALVLPSAELQRGESLGAEFRRDGRWALAALSVYCLLALVADWWFWRGHMDPRTALLIVPQIVLPLLYLGLASRRLQVAVTLVYVANGMLAAWLLSPAAYG